MRYIKIIFCLLGIVTLSACSTLPDELQLPEEQESTLIGYGNVIQNPQKYVGQLVRWGGIVAKVTNKPDHSIIEVTYYPLQHTGRPRIDEQHSAGRFRAKIPGLADPMVYKPGKAITFVGQLGQPQQSKIGEYNYNFPLLIAQQHKLWQELPDYDEAYYRYHGYPFYRPYSRGWGYPYYDYPYPHRKVKKTKPKTKKVSKPVKPVY